MLNSQMFKSSSLAPEEAQAPAAAPVAGAPAAAPAPYLETRIPVDYDPADLPKQHFYLDSVISGQANAKKAIEFGMGLSAKGVSLREQVDMKSAQEADQKALEFAQRTANLSDEEYRGALDKYQQELFAPPQAEAMPDDNGPGVGSMIAAMAAVLLDPSHAAELSAIPEYTYQEQRKQKRMELEANHAKAMEGWKLKVGGLMDVAQIKEKRLALDQEAVKDAMRSKDQRALSLLGAARSMQDNVTDLKLENAGSHFARLRELYKAAGYPELAPTSTEEEVTIKALKDKVERDEKLKDRTEMRKNIPTWVRALDGKNPAARAVAAFYLNGVFEKEPEAIGGAGYDPIDTRRKLDAVGNLSQKEEADLKIAQGKGEKLAIENKWLEPFLKARIWKTKEEAKLAATKVQYYPEYLQATQARVQIAQQLANNAVAGTEFKQRADVWRNTSGTQVKQMNQEIMGHLRRLEKLGVAVAGEDPVAAHERDVEKAKLQVRIDELRAKVEEELALFPSLSPGGETPMVGGGPVDENAMAPPAGVGGGGGLPGGNIGGGPRGRSTSTTTTRTRTTTRKKAAAAPSPEAVLRQQAKVAKEKNPAAAKEIDAFLAEKLAELKKKGK